MPCYIYYLHINILMQVVILTEKYTTMALERLELFIRCMNKKPDDITLKTVQIWVFFMKLVPLKTY